MAITKVTVTIDSDLLAQLDQLVAQHVFPNRSKAIQEALQDKLLRMRRSRLEDLCDLLHLHLNSACDRSAGRMHLHPTALYATLPCIRSVVEHRRWTSSSNGMW